MVFQESIYPILFSVNVKIFYFGYVCSVYGGWISGLVLVLTTHPHYMREKRLVILMYVHCVFFINLLYTRYIRTCLQLSTSPFFGNVTDRVVVFDDFVKAAKQMSPGKDVISLSWVVCWFESFFLLRSVTLSD